MKKTTSVIIFLLFLLHSRAQSDSSFRYETTVPGVYTSFAVDNLDNLYVLTAGNQLKKLTPGGDSVAVFNDVKRFGQASLIDASNPMKVLLYYRDFTSVVMLDRFLNIRNSIDLRKHGIFQVKAIGQSYDNKIWLYDEVNNRLKKVDEDGRVLLETPDFRQLFEEAPAPQMIFDQDQLVYLYDSAQAIYVFDYFGTLKNKIPITGWNNLKVAGHFIYGTTGNMLHRYSPRTLRTESWQMPQPLHNSRLVHFSANRVYALKENGIEIYSLH